VPIVFFDPSNDPLKGISNSVFQHIDMVPNILSYLNYPKNYIAFGKNIFKKNEDLSFAINYHNGYQLITRNTFIKYNEESEKVIAVFDLIRDPLLKNNILNTSDSIKLLKNKLTGFIQQYNNRMINNQLIIEN
jgi:hypothetical protein